MPRISRNIGGTLCSVSVTFQYRTSDASSHFRGEVSKEGGRLPTNRAQARLYRFECGRGHAVGNVETVKKQRTPCDIGAALLRQSVVRFREDRSHW